VDFSDDQHLQAAIAKNKNQLHGMKLSIARSDPLRNKKSRSSAAGSSRGRGTGTHIFLIFHIIFLFYNNSLSFLNKIHFSKHRSKVCASIQ
jgi:hypothetical protein